MTLKTMRSQSHMANVSAHNSAHSSKSDNSASLAAINPSPSSTRSFASVTLPPSHCATSPAWPIASSMSMSSSCHSQAKSSTRSATPSMTRLNGLTKLFSNTPRSTDPTTSAYLRSNRYSRFPTSSTSWPSSNPDITTPANSTTLHPKGAVPPATLAASLRRTWTLADPAGTCLTTTKGAVASSTNALTVACAVDFAPHPTRTSFSADTGAPRARTMHATSRARTSPAARGFSAAGARWRTMSDVTSCVSASERSADEKDEEEEASNPMDAMGAWESTRAGMSMASDPSVGE
ncbi:hypothetical protein BCR44DRAFT_1433579 [Catenaria anguillulae PL171]|uniref:Uncharacterized protein n=1 Tax=Catenaria anguillulae PL171 TaxID=765915 RepID=A0A1Y2HPS5_9FUNG|nr:hypothetical protein BCR44DRAFT_1433579 [Catenaria anguillulae PL171]